ncbi:putative toxin-antitoxin system toxin component, PIN family [Acidicapsa ligni]|uniref:putative toxin-antitoxin system toxin component, PIN family n=1 Tax=Acidicapsa ligni TaxID=542300 RepID=UPI0021E0C2A4|nr:putative toxin-antitoxin system toxin component, PIN family [Acidicapsa ligni]
MRLNPRHYVLDTSVIVSALRSRHGASNALLLLAQKQKFKIVASPPLFLEYEDVLLRPEQRLTHGLSIEEVNSFLAELAAIIIPVDIHFQWRPQVGDPGDEMVLEAAINGRANALVTHNIRHFAPAALRFQLSVLTPQQALMEISS